MKHRKALFFVVLSILLTAIPVSTPFAAVPKLINFQAQLADNLGMPLDGSYRMQFSLYDDPSIGNQLWSSGALNVSVADGILDVVLGSATPFSGAEFAGTRPVYIQIDIQLPGTTTWETLEPRQRLTAVPFALSAGDAETLNGMVETDFADVDHGHDFGDLHGEATDAQIPDTITVNQAGNADTVGGLHAADFARVVHNHDDDYVNEGQADSIRSAMIVDGTIVEADLRNGAVTADKIAPTIVSSLDGVVNDGGNIDLVAGTNVTITPNDGANTITIDAAGGGATDHGALTGLSDDDHPQYLNEGEGDGRYVNASGDSVTGNLTVTGQLYANGDLYAGTNLTTDNDFLFMDGGSQYFSWQESQGTFYINNDLSVFGVLQTGNTIANLGYNRLGISTASFGEITNTSDLLVSDDLEVGDEVQVGGNLNAGGQVRAAGDMETDAEFKYTTPKTFYLGVPACAFALNDSTQAGVRFAGRRMYTENGDIVYAQAPVQLPQGAVVTAIRAYYQDIAVIHDLSFTLKFVIAPYTSASYMNEAQLDVTTSDQGTGLEFKEVPTISSPTINNSDSQYILYLDYQQTGFETIGSLGFYGCRIEYTLQELKP